MNRLGFHHIIILALVVGGTFELIKKFRFSDPTDAAVETIGEVSPYARKDHDLSHSKAMNNVRGFVTAQAKPAYAQRRSGLFIPKTEGQFEAHAPKTIAGAVVNGQNNPKGEKKKTQTTAEKCRKKKAAEGEEVADRESSDDPKQLQFGQAKPEKEKEEVECEDEDKVAKNNEKPEEKPEETKPNDVSAFIAPTAVVGGLVIANNTDGDLAGLEEWKARLLNQPNFKETVRLIEAAQSGQISSELFYTLVRLMLNDSRQEIRELGVLAAGRTPSYESYHLLISVVKKETFGSRIRVKAESELSYYQQISQLTIMERVLKNSTDVFAVIWATRLVEDSARRYLNAKYNHSNGGTTTNPYVKRFTNFVAVLEELSKSTHDAQQAAQARQTLFSLQDLLKAYS